jgi:hypothetical protein
VSRRGPLLWADEFDGPAGAPVDPRTWRPETGGHGWGNAELQYYTGEPGNAALDGAGHLAITVRRADPGLAAARYDVDHAGGLRPRLRSIGVLAD